MARNFKDLEARMSLERIARSNELAKKMIAEIDLREKRKLVRKRPKSPVTTPRSK
jgi:hypothetical protein